MFNAYNDLVTVDEFCEMLSIGKNAAYTLLSSGKVKAFRINRVWKIPKTAVEQYNIKQRLSKERVASTPPKSAVFSTRPSRPPCPPFWHPRLTLDIPAFCQKAIGRRTRMDYFARQCIIRFKSKK